MRDPRRHGVSRVRLFVLAGSLILSSAIPAAHAGGNVRGIDNGRRRTLPGSVHPRARPELDQGVVDRGLHLPSLTLMLAKTPPQQAALDQLLEDQQDPSSPLYHRWLTPEEYADRFGASQADIDKMSAWLQVQGFTLNPPSRGRDSISFNGTVDQVEQAFGTTIHQYAAEGGAYYANATELTVPEALAALIAAVRGVDDFGPRPRRHHPRLPRARSDSVQPGFVLGGVGNLLAPSDVATIYDVASFYRAGLDGAGQTMVVAGQSDFDVADIRLFRRAFGLPQNDPRKILVPGSENPGIRSPEFLEADLDLEWAGAVAPNATVLYVFSDDVVRSVEYAIDDALAPVVSYSYLDCEASMTQAFVRAFRGLAQKANAEGITWVASSGDSGAAACENDNSEANMATTGLQVNAPASFPEVTGVGGTEFSEGSTQYWRDTPDDKGGMAVSYIPEVAWNDSTGQQTGFSATGGGLSALFARPKWQSAAGVSNGNRRAVPDVALASSPNHDAYYAVADGHSWNFGGTSAATPVFAAMVVLLNQYLVATGVQAQPGLGNINPNLYRLGRQSAGVFHDIVSGDNRVPCAPGSPDCDGGWLGYRAGPGYDPVTGLGSIDAMKLATQWNSGRP